MRYRKLSASGDMTFGQGLSNFWINVPDGVAQAALTRLKLYLGEWFYNTSDGTAWFQQVLGYNTRATRDPQIKQRLLLTEGVLSLISYSSSINPNTRAYTVTAALNTIYGVQKIVATITPPPPPVTNYWTDGFGNVITDGYGNPIPLP